MMFLLLIPLTLALIGLVHHVFTLADQVCPNGTDPTPGGGLPPDEPTDPWPDSGYDWDAFLARVIESHQAAP